LEGQEINVLLVALGSIPYGTYTCALSTP